MPPDIQANTPKPDDGPLSAEVYNRSLGLPPNINPVTRQWIDIAYAVAKLGDELIAELCRVQPETPFEADVAEAIETLDDAGNRWDGVRWIVTIHRNRQLPILRALLVANRELSELRETGKHDGTIPQPELNLPDKKPDGAPVGMAKRLLELEAERDAIRARLEIAERNPAAAKASTQPEQRCGYHDLLDAMEKIT